MRTRQRTFTYTHPTSIGDDGIKVAFTNDARTDKGDRNARIRHIVVNGERFETESPDVYSTGTWSRGNGCGPGNKQSEWLHCNGYFQYSIGDAGIIEGSLQSALAPSGVAENIVFIAVDDLKDWVGPSKPLWLQTPNIDALLADSVNFVNAQSTAVQCNPSRTSLWTGLRPSSHGLQDNMHSTITENGTSVKDSWRDWFADSRSAAQQNYGSGVENISTLFQHFKANGYYVASAGKVMHTNEHALEEQWDAFYPNENLPLLREVLNIPGGDDYGPVESYPLNGGFATESDLADHKTTWNTINILRALPANQPFFVSTGFWRPHNPNYVPQRFIDIYKNPQTGAYAFSNAFDAITVLAGDQDDTPNPLPDVRNQYVQDNILGSDEDFNEFLAHYAASISYIDEKIGELVDELKQQNRYDSTNIVFWSDHGYSVGEKEHVRKASLWRETTDTPMFIKSPQHGNAGRTVTAPVNSIDLFATLIDLVDLQHPTDYQRDSRSFERLLINPDDTWPWLGATEMRTTDAWQQIGGQQAKALRTPDYAFMEHFIGDQQRDPAYELYRYATDPNEHTNLLNNVAAASPADRQLQSELSDIARSSLGPQTAPVASGHSFTVTTSANQPSLVLEGTDDDRDYLEFTIESLPSSGTLYHKNADGTQGNPVAVGARLQNSPGWSAEVFYISNSTYLTGTDSFTYSVSDGIQRSAVSTVNITIEEGGDGLVLLDRPCEIAAGSLTANAPTNISIFANAACGVPTSGVSSVHVSVQALNATNVGNLRLSDGDTAAAGGVVNYINNGLDNANTVTVPVSRSGELRIEANNSGVDYKITLLGYHHPDGDLFYNPIDQCVVSDSRPNQGPQGQFVGPFRESDGLFAIDVVGSFSANQGGGQQNCGIPSTTEAVLMNVVAIQGSDAPGGVIVGTAGTQPSFSPVPFAPITGFNNSATTTVPLAQSGEFAGEVEFGISAGGSAHIRSSVLGYYARSGLVYQPINPCAVFDTRSAQGSIGAFSGIRAIDSTTTYQITGSPTGQGGQANGCGIPVDITAVLVSLEAVQPDIIGNFRLYASGSSATGAFVNFTKVDPTTNNANTAPVLLSAEGEVDLYVNGRPTDGGIPAAHARGVIFGYYR